MEQGMTISEVCKIVRGAQPNIREIELRAKDEEIEMNDDCSISIDYEVVERFVHAHVDADKRDEVLKKIAA